MSWSCLQIDATSGDIESSIRSAWEEAYAAAFLNFRHAVFRCRGYELFFSPAARELAEVFGASACEAPTREGLRLVAGDSRSWDVWFPSHLPRMPKRATLHLPKRAEEDLRQSASSEQT